ncbi:unnamed protein product [Rhizophagus irregularis]|nr:unnamed protein product [Rhizophagus irregularis]
MFQNHFNRNAIYDAIHRQLGLNNIAAYHRDLSFIEYTRYTQQYFEEVAYSITNADIDNAIHNLLFSIRYTDIEPIDYTLLRQDLINAYNLTNGFQQDPNEVLYQVSETTTSPEPEVLSDTTSENSEEEIPHLHIPLPPIYNTPNNPAPVIPPVINMAQPNQQDFQQLRAAIAALTQVLPNTNNALVGNTQAIANPPRREGKVAELPSFYGGNQDPVAWLEDFTRACNANELEQRRQQPGEDVNTYAAALQELYRRVETNAFTYPEAIKARKFVNSLLPDLYVTVKPHNDQTWNGAVDRAKAYELTHRDQGAVSAYLNKFTPMTTTDHTGDLLKAIQDLSKQVQSIDTTIAGPIGAARKYRRPAFKLGGVPQEGERTRQTTIPSNLTLLETYPATRTTRSKSRLDLTTGTVNDKPPEEETIVQTIQNSGKAKQPIRSTETKKVELKKAVKKKPAVVAPIYKMVEPYTPQQFFDQKADITNGQLLAMNPKFGLTVAKQLRKPVVRTKTEEQDKKPVKKDDEIPNNGNVSEVEDLMQVANTAGPNDDRTSALYCEASIKHI